MSSEEQRAWIYALVCVVVPVIYLVSILSELPGANVAEIAYVRPLLTAIGVGIVANIVLTVVAAVVSPKDAGKADERDREINRRGEHVGFYVMSVCAVGPLVLAMVKADHFWIANALYVSFVLAALASTVVKLVAYRRGW
ncbi:MFS family permease [Actinokineospora baliensis]|uniref:hypothetical protein n=1 Tax=Actinokineospora baliensis TaxID=547056 RepID=UPI00195AD55F|nr:hypothetical protein [Actinokineospora baliensis]MBM7774635.1 MFS family permease [Actinokineospora baliensis]